MTHHAVPPWPTLITAAITAALDQLKPRGGTGTGEAIQAAVRILRRAPGDRGKRPPAAIVLISDGAATGKVDPVAAAQQARRLRIPIYTVALGTPQGTIAVPRTGGKGGTETRAVPPDPQSLAEIARASRGQAYTATDAERLRAVYKHLGSQLGHKNEKRQITTRFAGGALALLLLGAAMSLAQRRRRLAALGRPPAVTGARSRRRGCTGHGRRHTARRVA